MTIFVKEKSENCLINVFFFRYLLIQLHEQLIEVFKLTVEKPIAK